MNHYNHRRMFSNNSNKRISIIAKNINSMVRNNVLNISPDELNLLVKFLKVYVYCGMPTVYKEWLNFPENLRLYEAIVDKYRTSSKRPVLSHNHHKYKIYNVLAKFYIFNSYILRNKIATIESSIHKCFGKRLKAVKLKYIEEGKELLTKYTEYYKQFSELEALERYNTIKDIESADDDHIYAFLVAMLRSEECPKSFENSINKIKKAFKKYYDFNDADILTNYCIDVECNNRLQIVNIKKRLKL